MINIERERRAAGLVSPLAVPGGRIRPSRRPERRWRAERLEGPSVARERPVTAASGAASSDRCLRCLCQCSPCARLGGPGTLVRRGEVLGESLECRKGVVSPPHWPATRLATLELDMKLDAASVLQVGPDARSLAAAARPQWVAAFVVCR